MRVLKDKSFLNNSYHRATLELSQNELNTFSFEIAIYHELSKKNEFFDTKVEAEQRYKVLTEVIREEGYNEVGRSDPSETEGEKIRKLYGRIDGMKVELRLQYKLLPQRPPILPNTSPLCQWVTIKMVYDGKILLVDRDEIIHPQGTMYWGDKGEAIGVLRKCEKQLISSGFILMGGMDMQDSVVLMQNVGALSSLHDRYAEYDNDRYSVGVALAPVVVEKVVEVKRKRKLILD